MRINEIIHKPIITEKSFSHKSGFNRYTFKVNATASKGAITKAITDLFDVTPIEVRTMIMPGKKKRVGRTANFTKRPKWKKAIVTLPEGQKIDLFPEGQ